MHLEHLLPNFGFLVDKLASLLLLLIRCNQLVISYLKKYLLVSVKENILTLAMFLTFKIYYYEKN